MLISCDFLTEDEQFIVKAPSIGRVNLNIKLHEPVAGGQLIGKLRRLNQSFDLKLDESCQGEVCWLKSADVNFAVGFGEPILKLQALRKAASSSVRIIDSEKYIDSPLEGLFYLAASPESPPYVKVGDEVLPGQILGLIEVMKCFYPLKYQGLSKAKILSIKVLSQTPVKSGTHLFAIG